jgi:hypothetical protein
MISRQTIAQVQSEDRQVHFILGSRLRSVKEIREEVLSRRGIVAGATETRPIFPKCDETVRGHVFCNFLALVLRIEPLDRLEAQGEKFQWAEVLRDLEALEYTEVEDQQTIRRSATLRTPAPRRLGFYFAFTS